jgi:hypothetical protein
MLHRDESSQDKEDLSVPERIFSSLSDIPPTKGWMWDR